MGLLLKYHEYNMNCEILSYKYPSGFYTKGCPLVKSNLICPSDKLSWQPGGPVLNVNI